MKRLPVAKIHSKSSCNSQSFSGTIIVVNYINNQRDATTLARCSLIRTLDQQCSGKFSSYVTTKDEYLYLMSDDAIFAHVLV